MALPADGSEIVFFDLETTIPTPPDQRRAILEFGAIVVCPKNLGKLDDYETLVRPTDPSLLSSLSNRGNGITPEAIDSAPSFAEIADRVFEILDGKIWAGHNILSFDCVIIREAFAELGRHAPEPKGTIDSLALLSQRFGKRAGDMKLATLATYFELGQQKHRSLADVRMNLEVLKHCATVLFLESSLLDIANPERTDFFDMGPRMNSADAVSESSSGQDGFIEPDKVSIPDIRAPFRGGQIQRIKILHRYGILQLHCAHLRVRFGLSKKYVDDSGRPRLSFVVYISPSLCDVLDACDSAARKSAMDSGSSSNWRPVVTRDNSLFNQPMARLRIPTIVRNNLAQYDTQIWQIEPSGTVQGLDFANLDIAELDALVKPGTFVDTFLSLETYDYMQSAGIRLVAKKLIIHCE